jgi:hypothetical protein
MRLSPNKDVDRLLEPYGGITPAELDQSYCRRLGELAMLA